MKTKFFRLAGIVGVIALILALNTIAQSVPPLINYQGQIANPDGTPLPTADYELTFRIYDTAEGSAVIWGPQIFNGQSGPGYGPKIPVVQGYFNVMIGPLDITERPLKNAFMAASRFVEITVGTRPPIMPRQQILSAPFALHAESAAKLSIAGTTGRIDAVNLDSSGRVGVGTTSPAATLDVAGSIRRGGALYPGLWRPEVISNDPRSGNTFLSQLSQNYVMNADLNSPNSLFRWYNAAGTSINAVDLTALSPLMVIDGNGRVGIGTSDPSLALEVAGGIKADAYVGNGVALTGVAPADGTVSRSKLAQEVIDSLVPPGTIIAFGGATPPRGWLLCDGTPYLRAAYPTLFGAIGTAWGADNAESFHVPDLRGMFLRGVNLSRREFLPGVSLFDPDALSRTGTTGGNAGNAVGSIQLDEIGRHRHHANPPVAAADTGSGRVTAGEDTSSQSARFDTEYTGGAETRPKNAYVHYVIKY